MVSRFRLGWLALHARMIRDWQSLDNIPARDYIIQMGGRRVYEVVWEPLLRGKFGEFADDVSAAWLWCKFVDRGGSRDGRGREVLGYVRGGLGAVFDRIVQYLHERGHSVHFNAPVVALEGTVSEIRTIVTASGSYRTDLVVAAAQTPDIAPLLPSAAAAYAGELGRIRFLANVCLVMTLERPLSDFYWTNVTDPSAPFVGIVEQTRWADPSHYAGHNIAYISAYVSRDDRRLALSADALLAGYLPHIRKMFPAFESSAVGSMVSWKASYAQPVVQVGYRALVPPIRSPIGNLLLCTMAQIYPHDRQVSNGVEMAKRTVDLMCANGRMR
jgi:protoporphyrinogen oxidase